MRILQVCPRSPVPAKDGGAQGMYYIANSLRILGHQVRTLTIGDQDSIKKAEPFQDAFPVRFVAPGRLWRAALRAIRLGIPFSSAKYSTPALVRGILDELERFPADLLWCDHAQLAPACAVAKEATGLPIAVRCHNLEWKIFQRSADNTNGLPRRLFLSWEASRLRRLEEHLLSYSDIAVAISREEQAWFQQTNPSDRILFMPAGFDGEIHPLQALPANKRILHVAPLDWVPNAQGLDWFLKSILPLVMNLHPDARVDIVGRNPPASLRAAHSENTGIMFHGFVEDLRRFEEDAKCLIVPLKAGAGVRIKILNALARGIPVVTTRTGCEGLPVVDGKHLFIADEEETFALRTSQVLTGDSEIERMREEGQRLVEKEFYWPNLVETCVNEICLMLSH